ncbi:hypothetical protein CVT26_000652 [Gymnopilus dilepis]|uniref:DUF6532 domain-containing protein n=1 Tax=Gymnopilus dilepis TaxID=231916 RepID=A0A409Y2N6_9AGAR|nr:hypothetical protein CVT26_000652 [Gymnopilus dilepis]
MDLSDVVDLQELRYVVDFLKSIQCSVPRKLTEIISKWEGALSPASSAVATSDFDYPELRYPTPSSPSHLHDSEDSSTSSMVSFASAAEGCSTPISAMQDRGTQSRLTSPCPSSDCMQECPAIHLPGPHPHTTSSGDGQAFAIPEYNRVVAPSCDLGESANPDNSSLSQPAVPQEGLQPRVDGVRLGRGQGGAKDDNSPGSQKGKNYKRGSRKGSAVGGGAGFIAKQSLLGVANAHSMTLRRRKEGGALQAAGEVGPEGPGGEPDTCCRGGAKAAPKPKSRREPDEALLEQEFRPATLPQGVSSEPESPPLSEDAHHLVLELSFACHRFLDGSHSKNPDHPVMQLVRLLTHDDSSHLAAQANASLASSFAEDSLESLAMRCSIADQNIATNFFALMLNVIQLRCRVIRAAFERNQPKNTVLKEIKYKGRCVKTLSEYVLDGAKFCLLAGGASIFILVFVAAANLQSTMRLLTHDTILRVYWLLRSPNPNHVLGKLVIQDIIPAVRELQRICRVKFSTVFNETLLFAKGVPPFTEAGDLTRSDEFFDNITFNAILKPRHKGHWLPCLQGNDIPVTETPFHIVNKAILSANSLSLQTCVPVYCDHTMELDSPLTPVEEEHYGGFPFEAGAEHSQAPGRKAQTFIIDTNFDPELEENRSAYLTKRGDKDFCFNITERERYLAGKAEEPSSLDDLRKKLQGQLAEGFKELGAYVNVTQDCANGTRIRVNDKNGDVIMFSFPDLPEDKRGRLMLALKAIFPDEVKYTDSEKEGAGFSFPARQFHFWNVYATHGSQYPDGVEPAVSLKNKASKKGKSNSSTCMPRASVEILQNSNRYRLLRECLADIFDWLRAVLKEALPEEFEIISGYADVLPADGFSPVYPFSGFVLNLNVCTKMHRDARDLRLCVVMALSDANCKGGDICFKEPGIRLQMRCGDVVVFPSSQLTHFNRHFKGERASLVFHTDSNGQVWVESFNHWGGSASKATNASKAPRSAGKSKTTGGGRPVLPPAATPSITSLPGISAAAMSVYRMIHAQLEAQKKAAKEAEDMMIRTRNRELLEADDGSGEEEADDAGTSSRKRKKTTAPVVALSDDEEELAAGLQSVRAAALGQNQDREVEREELQNELGSDEELAVRSRGEDDDDLPAELEGVDVDDIDIDMDLGSRDGELSNEIGVDQGSEGHSASAPTSRSKSKTPCPKTPSSSNAHTSKVVEKDFTPRTLRLALAAKGHVRTRTIYEEPFPRNNKISRINFAWKTIKESAIASDDSEVRSAFTRAKQDVSLKSKLMKFTLYGRTGLISSIISKARDKVRAFYGLSGDPDVVKKDVEWLLKDSHFVYGGIDLKGREVDAMQPFGCQLIVDIIEAQWFPSTSRSKLDLETTNRIYEKRDLPLNVLLLSVTAIEHGLKEWSANGRKACQITFSEDTAKQSYERHLGHWRYFEAQMKAWPTWFKRKTLGQILANHSNFDINAEENDFAGLDFAALDGLAGYIAEEEEALEDVQVGGGQSVPELSEAERGDTTTGSEAPLIV